MAMTLGHTILGESAEALDIARDHKTVHVRQFERWGPLMGACLHSLVLRTLGYRAPSYRDNPFEREAFREDEANNNP